MKLKIGVVLNAMLGTSERPSPFTKLTSAAGVTLPVAFALAEARAQLEPVAERAWKMLSENQVPEKQAEVAALLESEVEVQVTPIRLSACERITDLTANEVGMLMWLFSKE